MPLTPLQLKFLIYERGYSIQRMADEIGCFREELSMTIRRVRTYPRIRLAVADLLGRPVEELFGETPTEGRRQRAA